MDLDTAKKLAIVRAAAQTDGIYLQRLETLRQEERRLDGYEMEMNELQRHAMWDFFDALEDVNCRLMEVACQVLTLPEKQGE